MAINSNFNVKNGLSIGSGATILNTFENRIGIGKTDPNTILDVAGTITATYFSGSGISLTGLPANQLSGTIPSGVLNNSSLFIGTTAIRLNRISGSGHTLEGIILNPEFIRNASGTGSTPSYAFLDDTGTGMWRPGANNIAISTGASERIRITSSGNIGIGTTNPLVRLQVSGTVGFNDTNIRIGDSTTGAIAIATGATGAHNIFMGVSSGRSNTTGSHNIFLGCEAGQNNTTGSFNNFFGWDAGTNNVTGSYNNFIGRNVGAGNTGSNNNFIGFNNGIVNSGNDNNFFGDHAGYGNTTGCSNNFFGLGAGRSNATGSFNNYIGHCAGYGFDCNGTSGSHNNFFGAGTGRSIISGSHNNFFGSNAGIWTTTGSHNNFFGCGAGNKNVTGSCNNFFGFNAGINNTTGSNNIAIGYGSGATDTTYNGLVDLTTQSNNIVMGNNTHTNAYIKVAWTVGSDERDKMNFTTVPHGINFVKNLNPVAFQFKEDRNTDVPTGPVRYGFKAQEILALEGNNPVIIDNNDPNYLRYTSDYLIPVLVKAIKEQQELIEAQQQQINTLLNN